MSELIIVALAVAVLVLASIVRRQSRLARELHEALEQRRAHVPPEGASALWQHLSLATNSLLRDWQEAVAHGTGQLHHLEATLGSLAEAVLIVDDSDQVRLANAALQRILPRVHDARRQRLQSVLRSAGFLDYVARLRAGRPAAQIEVELHEDGTTLWLEVMGTRIPPPPGERDQWLLFVLHDITRQRTLENVRKEFVANVSHELRTPLSVIKGYVETLVDSHREMSVADRDRFLRTIQRHAERLHSILEDLLTLSRLESKTPGLVLEPLELGPLLQQFVEDNRSRLAHNGHDLLLEIDSEIGTVIADRIKLLQVFDNLVDNAIKYTPPRSRIAVAARRVNGEFEVRVSDNGPGIPASDLDHIFERFYRVDKGRSREKGGTGLGLSIVKHIVQLHGGRIWAESELGRGTTIAFTLPLRSA
jgi:two-component system phosphate regulon sensor histidine kinase PhoR